MDAPLSSSKLLCFFLLSITFFVSSSSGSFLSDLKPTKRAHQLHKLASHRRELIQTTQHDFSTFPTSPVTNPVTTPSTGGGAGGTIPPDTLTPPMITVPSASPVTTTPTPITIPPATDPINNPTVPVTNPVTTPSTTFPGGGTTNPVVAPPAFTNAPAVPGQSWCVARGGLPESVVQVALDYACGIGGADCSAIQDGASCYNPNSLQNHASYAFNTYFQKNPVQTSCDFGGAAMITNVNPSSGSCIFSTASSSSGTVSPTTTTPIPTPTTDSSTGAVPASSGIGAGSPPTLMNASNPALGGGITGFGDIPPTASTTSSGSTSSSLNPFICCITVAASIITGSNARRI